MVPNTARGTPTWAFSLLGINLVVTMIVCVIQAATYHAWSWPELIHSWMYALVYANLTGVPAILWGQKLVVALARTRVPFVFAVAIVMLLFAAAGCLASQSLLAWLRIVVPQNFWVEYLHTLRIALLLALVFGLGAYFFVSMRDRLRATEGQLHEKEIAEERALKLAAEARLRSLESRIHPHFLFNTLNSISALIALDPARAEETIGRLAALLRASLDTTSQPLIPLHQELAMVAHYIDIEKIRFGEKLRGSVDVPAELQDAKVPPMSIQSLVENAVKHGITSQSSGGDFLVTAFSENGSLHIEVRDSGPGFDLTAIPAGHGLDNLVERLDTLFGAKARLNVYQRDGRAIVEMVLPRL
jgi:two-component system sensor histidine kinase AlgZ